MGDLRTSTEFSVRPDEAIALLRLMPLLQQLPEDTLEKICEALQPMRFGPGEPIVRLNCEGVGLYIIWKGEAKVISPPNAYPSAHKESFLKRSDYFGTGLMGPLKQKYKVDVVAIDEINDFMHPEAESELQEDDPVVMGLQVLCLVLPLENADLLAAASLWDWDTMHERPSIMEQMTQLETVGAVEDLKMEGQGFPHYYAPFLQATRRKMGRLKVNRNYFGGQYVCQALLAATKTVDPELLVHSLHSYFIQTADVDFSCVYEVERVRDGRSFATRHVKAKQREKLVFLLYASFKREEKGFEYREPMPSVLGPEEVISTEQMFDDFIIDPCLSLDAKKDYSGLKFPLAPIDMRNISPVVKFHPEKVDPPRQLVWIRARSKISAEQSVHRCIATYASDLPLLETSLRTHAETLGASMQILSLDHTIWFHESFNANEWLLFVIDNPVTTDGRGLTWGKVYTQDGREDEPKYFPNLVYSEGGGAPEFATQVQSDDYGMHFLEFDILDFNDSDNIPRLWLPIVHNKKTFL